MTKMDYTDELMGVMRNLAPQRPRKVKAPELKESCPMEATYLEF